MKEQTSFNHLEIREGIYLFVRRPAPYTNVEEIAEEAAFWRGCFPASLRAQNVMIRDLRLVQGNNNPEIDKARNEHNGTLFRGWVHVTALTQTVVGALHARRAFEAMGVLSIGCFNDASAAMADAKAHRIAKA